MTDKATYMFSVRLTKAQEQELEILLKNARLQFPKLTQSDIISGLIHQAAERLNADGLERTQEAK